jgi:hypothetical protein
MAKPSTVRLFGLLVVIAGAIMVVAGAVTWFTVKSQLADEQITVSDDAAHFAGQPVNGPFTAYAQANVIEMHTMNITGNKTYAQLDKEDPARQTAMTSSFLRSSLFTSVVAFGVAFMAAGIGVVLILIGLALKALAGALPAPNAPPVALT